jgi:hypothetical protein
MVAAEADMRQATALTKAASAFLGANLLHGADHLRQRVAELATPIKAGGALVTLAAVAVVVLALRRHDLAVPAAAAAGFATALLVTSAHVLPHWSVLSNSYVDDLTVDGLSWAVVLLEIAAAFVLGCVALQRLRPSSEVLHG